MKSVGEALFEAMNFLTPEIEATYPESEWQCEVCGSINSNWTVNPSWMVKKTSEVWIQGGCPNCEKISKLRERQRFDAEVQKAKLNRIQQIFQRSGIPADYAKFSFSKLEIRPGAEKAFCYLKDVANFENGQPFLILSGPNNTGKSALLGALTNRLAMNEVPCFYINEPVLFGKIKEGFDSTEPIEKELYEAFGQAEVVMWDEFLFYNYTEKQWIYERAYRVIEEAVERRKVIVFATNYELPDLLPRCGKRIWARLSRRGTNFIKMENQPFFSGINVL
jgi:DNA replication protein DnaC